MKEGRRLVWDLPLRLFHWLLAISLCASWATAEPGSEWMLWHFRIGYFIIGLIVFRVLWGFVGPQHARFAHFLPTPAKVWRYSKTVFRRTTPPTVGHNPLGSLMVYVLLILVAVQAGTGLFASDDIIWTGPYNPAVSGDTADELTALHHQNFTWLQIAVAIHILAVVFYWVVKKQNLVRPMITGTQRAELVPESEAISSSHLIRAAIVIAISAGAVYWLLAAAPPEPEFFY